MSVSGYGKQPESGSAPVQLSALLVTEFTPVVQ
jgi:hypothetical protein